MCKITFTSMNKVGFQFYNEFHPNKLANVERTNINLFTPVISLSRFL